MSRDHQSLHSAAALLVENGTTVWPGGRHRAPSWQERLVAAHVEAAVLAMHPVDPDILELVVQLDALGADVRVLHGEVANGHCTSCQMRHAVADVRVYDGGVAYDEMCRECAPAAVKAATSDAVKVEVLA